MELGAWGVDEGYWDVAGHWHEPPPETLAAVGEAMRRGAPEGASTPPSGPPLWFVRAGTVEYLQGPADLVLEDGTLLAGQESLPPSLPTGYHDLHPLDGGPTTRLVVTPGRCRLPPHRMWGLTSQLYAARSRDSWGIGDFGDLRRLGAWLRGLGGDFLGVSPLHSPGPALPVDPSPYHPSSRRFLNPLMARIEDVPGSAEIAQIDRLANAGRALGADRHIHHDEVWRLKREALETAFAVSGVDPGVDAFVQERPSVTTWARFCAIADQHGNDWRRWPAELRHPSSPAVAAHARSAHDRVRFHEWVQWVLDRQLERAGAALPLLTDLAVGFDPGGADAWEMQEVLALDMRVGAPPDDFNGDGQDWGLPPFVPWRLRAAGYAPFIETVRAALRHAGGLRIDHVMGLFRLFWVPADAGPRAGTYVRYAAGELLDLLALESERADAFVVGEDLGTVEDSVRSELADRQVLSYRLLWFEDRPTAEWPVQALAAVSTHDLPTVAGLWRGTDPAADEMVEVRERLASVTGAEDAASVEEVAIAAHRALAASPSLLVAASLDDLMAVEERPNLPGTVLATNWTTALPRPIDDLDDDPGAIAVLDVLSDGS